MIEILETEADIREDILDVLNGEAEAVGHRFEGQTVSIVAKDGEHFRGGLFGKIMLERLYVELLGVTADARGQNVGERLMRVAETKARERGLKGVYLDTYSFQAPGFYEKIGYMEFGRLRGEDGEPDRIYYETRF